MVKLIFQWSSLDALVTHIGDLNNKQKILPQKLQSIIYGKLLVKTVKYGITVVTVNLAATLVKFM